MRTAKAVLAAIGILVTVLTGVLADNVIGIDEWQALAAAAAEAIALIWAIWRVPNAGYVDVMKLRPATFDAVMSDLSITKGARH